MTKSTSKAVRPRPIRANEPDSWAQYTVHHRQPAILRQVLADNKYPPHIEERLRHYLAAFPDMRVRPLADNKAPDAASWASILRSIEGRSWLEIPWLIQEFAYYRYLLEAVGYFEDGPTRGQDPFAAQKREGLLSGAAAIEALASRPESTGPEETAAWAELDRIVAVALWGNQADLSMWPVGGAQTGPAHIDHATRAAHTLVDHREALRRWLESGRLPLGRIDIIADNAGFELVTDLTVADFLLRQGLTRDVRLHLKAYPTFVSDAMPTDVAETLNWLEGVETPATHALGQRLRAHWETGRLQLTVDGFWNLPFAFWDMPEPLQVELGEANLILIKGDANYRRLLGDLHWPFTTPLNQIADYMPAPFLALRTVKAELAAGLTSTQVALLERVDVEWLTSGRWGVIQFVPAGSN